MRVETGVLSCSSLTDRIISVDVGQHSKKKASDHVCRCCQEIRKGKAGGVGGWGRGEWGGGG